MDASYTLQIKSLKIRALAYIHVVGIIPTSPSHSSVSLRNFSRVHSIFFCITSHTIFICTIINRTTNENNRFNFRRIQAKTLFQFSIQFLTKAYTFLFYLSIGLGILGCTRKNRVFDFCLKQTMIYCVEKHAY